MSGTSYVTATSIGTAARGTEDAILVKRYRDRLKLLTQQLLSLASDLRSLTLRYDSERRDRLAEAADLFLDMARDGLLHDSPRLVKLFEDRDWGNGDLSVARDVLRDAVVEQVLRREVDHDSEIGRKAQATLQPHEGMRICVMAEEVERLYWVCSRLLAGLKVVDDPGEMISQGEAAAMLQLSPGHVGRMINKGAVSWRTNGFSGKGRRISRADVEAERRRRQARNRDNKQARRDLRQDFP